MLAGTDGASAPQEGLFPLGPFPRHLWIHSKTPEDSLDKVCYKIWKRVQRLPAELQLPATGLHADQPGILPRDTITFQSHNYWVDEPKVLEDIYRTVIANREREMKLRALCDYRLSVKSIASNLPSSTKSHKNSKGLKYGSMTDTHSKEGSKQKVPFPLRCTVTATGAGDQVTAEKTKVVKELVQKSMFSSAESGTTPSSTAASHIAGQKRQLPPLAESHSKIDVNTVTKNPVTATVTSGQENIKYFPSTSGSSTTSTTTTSHQPVPQSVSFPLFSTLPNHSNPPQYQGLFHLGARILFQPAPPPPFGYYLRQAAPYNPPLVFQPPYTVMPYCIPLVQPAYPHQKTPPTCTTCQHL